MRHGGNIDAFARQIGCKPEQIIDFSANINPQQAVAWQELNVALTPYSDPDYGALKHALRQRYLWPDSADIEVFNGASAAIFALLRYLQPQDVVLYAPLYGEYQRLASALGCKLHCINRFANAWDSNASHDIPERSTVIFVNPATPDGTLYDMQALLTQWQAKQCQIIIDESFLDFCAEEGQGGNSVSRYLAANNQLYIIKSLSKFYGCAGIRIGFIASNAQFIEDLKQFEPAWKLSSFDMAYMIKALANQDFIAKTREQTAKNRCLLQQALQQSKLFDSIYPSQANFLLARLANGVSGYDLQNQLIPARLLIRVCDNFLGLDQRYVRFAVKEPAAIKQLQDALPVKQSK